jgi:TPR repeat protein
MTSTKIQTNVGYLLQAGLGTSRDDPQALQWFRRAADQSSARGMYYIA